MTTELKPCYECENKRNESELQECESCEGFICIDCIESCEYVQLVGDTEQCGSGNALNHAGCEDSVVQECATYDCTNTFCENHEFSCMDCDQAVCHSCAINCEYCYSPSCIDVECGGYCDVCKRGFCEDHIVMCQEEECSVMLCSTRDERYSKERCAYIFNMQTCSSCEMDFCADHLQHECHL